MHVTRPIPVFFAALMLVSGGRTSLGQEKKPPFSLGDPQTKRAVVATVGPLRITAEEFRLSFEFGPAYAKRTGDAKERYLGYMINEKLLALGAASRRDEATRLIEPALAEIEGDLATEELYKDDVQSKVKVSGAEIAQGIQQSRRHLTLQWIYAPTEEPIGRLAANLRAGASFDSLYRLQGPDSLLASNRSLEATLFQVRMKNPEIAGVADTLKPLHPSSPLKGPDGWYILRIANESREVLSTQSDEAKLGEDVSRALLQKKSDSLSQLYVNALMTKNHPVIVPETFDLVSSYLAPRYLDSSDVRDWGMVTPVGGGMNRATLEAIDGQRAKTLVTLSQEGKISLGEFLAWFADRETLIKLQKSSKEAYLFSLQQMIWQMVRDHILVAQAFKRGFQNRESVRTQKKWWKEKLLFEAEKRLMQDSISFHDKALLAYYEENRRHYKSAQGNPLDFSDARDNVLRDYFEYEMTKRILHRLNDLKLKYRVRVDEKVLARIPVGGDPKAIDVYAVKKGGTFPRQAFPVIDMLWQTWK